MILELLPHHLIAFVEANQFRPDAFANSARTCSKNQYSRVNSFFYKDQPDFIGNLKALFSGRLSELRWQTCCLCQGWKFILKCHALTWRVYL